jgi:hypothetical protein
MAWTLAFLFVISLFRLRPRHLWWSLLELENISTLILAVLSHHVVVLLLEVFVFLLHILASAHLMYHLPRPAERSRQLIAKTGLSFDEDSLHVLTSGSQRVILCHLHQSWFLLGSIHRSICTWKGHEVTFSKLAISK